MGLSSLFLDKILREAAKKRARSLYLAVSSYPVFRVENSLIPWEEEILNKEKIEKIIESFLSPEELEILKKERELIIVKEFVNNLSFRVNIFYQRDFPTVTFHYISPEIRELNSLGLPPKFMELVNYNSGLLVITGPNNSGKTSTVASIIKEINQNKKKYIVTLEELVERRFVNEKSIISQREIGRDVKTYKEGLINCLEEDVDLVYVGEMREEFDVALPYLLELSAGNCLVIMEMDSEYSVRAIEKILSALEKTRSRESASYFLADVLIGVLAQKLLPNKKKEFSLAVELLLINTPVKSLIRDNNIYQLDNIIQNYMNEGMVSMKKSIQDLISEDLVSSEEVEKWNFSLNS